MKSVQTNFINQEKLDVIESSKVKVNEYDERILAKTSVHADGRLHADVVPVNFYHQQKLKAARKELNSIQDEFKSVLANPAYDDQVEQIHEVEKLKVELARKGVQATVETLKRGMVLPDRDNPET